MDLAISVLDVCWPRCLVVNIRERVANLFPIFGFNLEAGLTQICPDCADASADYSPDDYYYFLHHSLFSTSH